MFTARYRLALAQPACVIAGGIRRRFTAAICRFSLRRSPFTYVLSAFLHCKPAVGHWKSEPTSLRSWRRTRAIIKRSIPSLLRQTDLFCFTAAFRCFGWTSTGVPVSSFSRGESEAQLIETACALKAKGSEIRY